MIYYYFVQQGWNRENIELMASSLRTITARRDEAFLYIE